MIKELTEKYVANFSNKDLDGVLALMTEDFALEDPVVNRIEGRQKVSDMISDMFKSNENLKFNAKNIYVVGDTSMIEFELELGEITLKGVDIIEWNDGFMTELRAYLDVPKS